MVRLAVVPAKGNAAARQFPYSGYLALTPVKVEGVVHTAVDPDAKLLPSKSVVIAIRCYETRLGRLGSYLPPICLAEYIQVLWEKPHDLDYGDLGGAQLPFKLVVPPSAPAPGTLHFPEYRIFWRLEAIVNHIPMVGVGSRLVKYFDLPLVRYDTPLLDPAQALPSYLLPFSETRKPRAPAVRYRVLIPSTWIGPADLVSIPLAIHPHDPDIVIRAASLIVERRIELRDEKTRAASSPASPSARVGGHSSSPSASFQPTYPTTPSPTGLHTPSLSRSSSANASSSLLSSSPSSTSSSMTALNCHSAAAPSTSSMAPLLPNSSQTTTVSDTSDPTGAPSRTITSSVAAVESMGPFTRDADGLCTKMLTLQWPEPKSQARWAVGHTVHTSMASVRYFARTKIIVSSAHGTESLELDERELFILPTNDAERRVAMAKYADARTRSKSKSPRRASSSKSDPSSQYANPLPSPPQSPSFPDPNAPPVPVVPLSATIGKSAPVGMTDYGPSTATRGSKSSGGTPRRPHTSAGATQKAQSFGSRPATALPSTAMGGTEQPATASARRKSSPGAGRSPSSFAAKFRREGRERDRTAPPSSVLVYLPPEVQQTHAQARQVRHDAPVANAPADQAPFLVSPAHATSISGRRNRISTVVSESPLVTFPVSSVGIGIGVDVDLDTSSLASDKVRAWEAELSQIEAKSSRSSAGMLRFKRSKKDMDRESSTSPLT